MSLLRLKERNELDMTPTETAEVYHVTNRIVVPQLTGTAVPTEVDVDDLIHFEPKETMKTASGFVVGEEDTSKDTTACTASGNDGDKKINERDLNDKSVLRSRVARRVTIKDNPSESSKPESSGHDQKDHEPKPRRNTNSWGHDFHNKLKEVATHDQVVEVTKTMSIDEKTLNTDKLPLVLLPPGPGGGVEANDKVKRDHLAHHDPVPATKSKSKPESSEPLQSKSKPESQSSEKKNEQKQKETEKKPGEKHHYHRPDLEAKKKDKSPLVQAVEDVALRFGQKDENFHHVKNKKPDDKKMKHEQDKRDWIHPGQNPKPKVGADPTPREPKTVNLGENYGTEGLHKVQGTVHLPDGRVSFFFFFSSSFFAFSSLPLGPLGPLGTGGDGEREVS